MRTFFFPSIGLVIATFIRNDGSTLPLIGLPTKFNEKGKRKLTIEELLENKTPYPTIVVPVGKNGFCAHAVCMVDDLIFDSITLYALLMKMESFE